MNQPARILIKVKVFGLSVPFAGAVKYAESHFADSPGHHIGDLDHSHHDGIA